MPLALTDDHAELADVAKAMVAGRGGMSNARRILLDAEQPGRWWEHDGLWKEIAATGWLGLHVEERFGGQGYGLAELSIVIEQLGRSAIGGPFLPTVAVSAVIAEIGTEDQRRRWLPRLVTGETIAGIGTAPDGTLGDSVVSARAVATLAEPSADLFLLTVGHDLVLIEAGTGIAVQRTDSVDQVMRPITVLGLSSAPVAEFLPGGAPVAARLLRLLVSAEAVGGLAACTEMSTAYAATREQFGRPIGSFQAVKHHCANMFIDTEAAVAVTWAAAKAASGPEAELVATMAAAHALPAYQRVALQNVQIHGGVGYTWEHDAHLYIRRATVLLAFAGGQDLLTRRATELQSAGVRPSNSVDLPADAEQYRHSARAFRAELEHSPNESRQKVWAHSGYLQPHWPTPYGRGADSIEQLVIEEELAGLDKPSLGLGEWVVPTLLQHGSPEQIERLLWPSLEGELRWCQLFSEPGAGSDAAAVATRARRVDDGWIVIGQKVWTSDATNCQRGLATVRTDSKAPKHKGITALIIDLADPAVDIRPLREITGETLFNEVFLNDVFVPDRDVVGAVNAGWSVAMATLGNERVSIGGGSVTMTAGELVGLLARHAPDDRGLARDVGALLVEGYAILALNLRQAARAVFDTGPGVEGNVVKGFGAEHAQRVAELAMRIAGPAILTGGEPGVVYDYLFSRCLTIAGGTSEIVRNLIAERILRLPRDPAPK